MSVKRAAEEDAPLMPKAEAEAHLEKLSSVFTTCCAGKTTVRIQSGPTAVGQAQTRLYESEHMEVLLSEPASRKKPKPAEAKFAAVLNDIYSSGYSSGVEPMLCCDWTVPDVARMLWTAWRSPTKGKDLHADVRKYDGFKDINPDAFEGDATVAIFEKLAADHMRAVDDPSIDAGNLLLKLPRCSASNPVRFDSDSDEE